VFGLSLFRTNIIYRRFALTDIIFVVRVFAIRLWLVVAFTYTVFVIIPASGLLPRLILELLELSGQY